MFKRTFSRFASLKLLLLLPPPSLFGVSSRIPPAAAAAAVAAAAFVSGGFGVLGVVAGCGLVTEARDVFSFAAASGGVDEAATVAAAAVVGVVVVVPIEGVPTVVAALGETSGLCDEDCGGCEVDAACRVF